MWLPVTYWLRGGLQTPGQTNWRDYSSGHLSASHDCYTYKPVKTSLQCVFCIPELVIMQRPNSWMSCQTSAALKVESGSPQTSISATLVTYKPGLHYSVASEPFHVEEWFSFRRADRPSVVCLFWKKTKHRVPLSCHSYPSSLFQPQPCLEGAADGGGVQSSSLLLLSFSPSL